MSCLRKGRSEGGRATAKQFREGLLKGFQFQIARCVSILAVLLATCVGCALAIHYFYGLHGAATLWPYKSLFEQDVAIARTAAIGTVASSWAIWFGARRGRNTRSFALWAGLGILVTLVLYGWAGCGGVLGGDSRIVAWNEVTEFVFPSTFFAEFNFLTFIFEIAPVTALAEVLLLYLFSKRIFPTARTGEAAQSAPLRG
jgi:hypothetical protein